MFKNFKSIVTNWFGKKQTTSQNPHTWTKEQESELVSLMKARVPKARISEITGRSLNSINYKLIQTFGSSKVSVLSNKLVRIK